VANASGLNLEVVGLVAPLLILSYVAYREGSGRIAEAEHHVREVEHLYQATVETLAIAVDSKDQVTHGHIRRVQRHTLAVATALGITDATELKALEAASLLHDVGKIAVPDYVLNKPGTLSPAEFEAIKIHAAEGAKILTAVGFPYPVVPVVRHHHERWDGRGYPDGLAGSAIPIGARILAVVDCFDALTSDRQYRRKLSDVDAIEILRERAGTFYDPAVVEAFFALIPALRDDDLVSLREEPLSIASAGGARVMLDRSPAVAAGYPDTPGLLMLRAVSARLVSRCADTVPDAEACLFAPDGTGDVLLVATATRRLGDAVDGLKFRIGEGLSGWVATNRRTVVNSDPTLDFGDLSARLGLRSCVSTPVFALGDLVGVLSVYSPKTRGFSESDARLVGGLAQEIGLAIARHGSERHHDGKYTATGSGLAAVS
jgi:putative nucleotidyltransferase with HDIG domain